MTAASPSQERVLPWFEVEYLEVWKKMAMTIPRMTSAIMTSIRLNPLRRMSVVQCCKPGGGQESKTESVGEVGDPEVHLEVVVQRAVGVEHQAHRPIGESTGIDRIGEDLPRHGGPPLEDCVCGVVHTLRPDVGIHEAQIPEPCSCDPSADECICRVWSDDDS